MAIVQIVVAQAKVDRQTDAMIAGQLIVPIVQPVVQTETEIPVRVHVRHQIVQRVRIAIDQIAVMIVVQLQIVRVATTHLLVIVRKLVMIEEQRVALTALVTHAHHAMIVTRVHLRVTANAVVVRIAPVVDTPMIAKSVHAVA
jgi:hypothetical protein